jgi:protein-disulfide isomerase
MMKKASTIIALVVGLALGVALDRAVALSPARAVAPAPAPAAQAQNAPAPNVPPAPAQAQKVDDPKAVYRVPLEDSPVRGPSDALVTIVEVSDFECPFCKRAAPTMREIEKAYGAKVRFAFKHNPLSMHAHAVEAANLAEEARVRGGDAKFWAMHDKLFELPALDAASMTKAAGELGIPKEPAQQALTTNRFLDRIRRDQNLVNSLGARGTPTFLVNGRKVVGAQPFAAFKAVIDEELAKAETLAKSGVKAKDVYARTIEKGATAPVLVDAPTPTSPPTAAQAAAAKVPLRSDEAVKGPKLAPVTIALFSDFQCPFCSKVEPTLKQIEQAFPGKVRFAWRHQPLPFHPNALPAAKAAEAARAQGKFWDMHDKLFANQQALSEATYEQYAKELKLDLARFKRDAAAEGTATRIAEDQQIASSVGATGTPTLFVNCRKVVGAQPFESLKPIVEEELKKADAMAAKGDKIDAGFYDRICAANVAAAPPVAAPSAPAPRTDVAVALRSDDPARGDARAPVTVVEFSDFQCPFCSRAVPAVKEVEQAFGKDVRVVWKHLPLAFHPNAMPAALAAEAAREQGKFWEMHDKLFANQQALSDASYEQYAKELKLDLGRFQAARQSPETKKRVEADLAAATAAGVTGTPTFVVNGEVVVGSGGLREVVDRRLKAARLAHR